MFSSLVGRMLLVLTVLLPLAAHAQITPAGPAVAQQAESSWQRLKRLFGGDAEPQLLPPEQAFTVTMRARDASSLTASFAPASGYYLYRDRISFAILEPAGMQVANVALPAGEWKNDPTFGKVEVYHRPFEAVVTLRNEGAYSNAGRVQFSYQGCSDSGVCYPPQEKIFDFVLPAMTAADASAAPGAAVSANQSAGDTALPAWLDAERSAALFAGKGVVLVAAFFGFGLLLSFTPCVWPMFPILSGIIAGQGPALGRARAFWLSASYVLGMALVYAAAGVAAGLSGTLLSSALQTPWVLAAMAAVFILLALSMFGLYELQLPAFLQSRLAAASNRISRRSVASVFAMGGVSAIIVGPCVAAPLAGALLYISQTGDVVLGASALFALALGKGVPLLIIGTSLGSLLPRAGAWMDAVKVFFGVLLLLAALWVVSPFIPVPVSMGLAGVLLVGYAVYLRVFDALPAQAGGAARVGKAFGVVGLMVGAIYLVGAFSGSRDFLQPLAGLNGGPDKRTEHALPFTRVSSVAELDAAIANAPGRYVMLDFYADWCVSCKEMEYFTLSDPAVKTKLQDVLLLQADVTANSAEDKQLLARFGLFGPPGIIFFDASGQEIRGRRVIGFMEARRFLRVLNEVFPAQRGSLPAQANFSPGFYERRG